MGNDSRSQKKAGAASAANGGGIQGKRTRPRNRASMAQVAEIAGCSQSTVSVLLNETPGYSISDATKTRVFAAVKELNYQIPKRRKDHSSKKLPIAFVVDRMVTSPETTWAIDGAHSALLSTGQVLLSAQTLDDEFMIERTLKHFKSQKIAGLIYASVHTREIVPPQKLFDFEVPVILLNCYANGDPFRTVVPGETAAGHRATNHLIAAGHKRIANITGELWMEAAEKRLEGYRRALASADLPYDPELVKEGNWQFTSGYSQTMALMELSDPPTAIFCASDRIASGCFFALTKLGVSIPDEMSVIGFDNEEISHQLTPKLTTLELPLADMGRWAVEQILSDQNSQSVEPSHSKFDCALIERGSVTAPRSRTLKLASRTGK